MRKLLLSWTCFLLFTIVTLYSCKQREVLVYLDRIKTVDIQVTDTVYDYKVVPMISSAVLPIDSTSFLFNTYSTSTCSLVSGLLVHSLSQKDTVLALPISYKTITISDSIPYPVKVVEVVKTVDYRGWFLFLVLILIDIIYILIKIKKTKL